jgi:hypothetical protein
MTLLTFLLLKHIFYSCKMCTSLSIFALLFSEVYLWFLGRSYFFFQIFSNSFKISTVIILLILYYTCAVAGSFVAFPQVPDALHFFVSLFSFSCSHWLHPIYLPSSSLILSSIIPTLLVRSFEKFTCYWIFQFSKFHLIFN